MGQLLVCASIFDVGHFGCVYRGLVCSEVDKEEMEVAVKTLKPLIGIICFLGYCLHTVD